MIVKDLYNVFDFESVDLLTVSEDNNRADGGCNVIYVSENPAEDKEELLEFADKEVTYIWPYNMGRNLCLDVTVKNK